MGSFNCAEFRAWHSTGSFTELQTIGMENSWKGHRTYSPTLSFWIKFELFLKVPYIGNVTSSQTNRSRTSILLTGKYFLPIFYSYQLQLKPITFYPHHLGHEENCIPFNFIFDSRYFKNCLFAIFSSSYLTEALAWHGPALILGI